MNGRSSGICEIRSVQIVRFHIQTKNGSLQFTDDTVEPAHVIRKYLFSGCIWKPERGCIQKFPDWAGNEI